LISDLLCPSQLLPFLNLYGLGCFVYPILAIFRRELAYKLVVASLHSGQIVASGFLFCSNRFRLFLEPPPSSSLSPITLLPCVVVY
jgi:hypothetical protein